MRSRIIKLVLLLFWLPSLVSSAEKGWNSLELAKAYFSHSENQRSWAWMVLRECSWKGTERVLDFGCGDGKITAELSCLVPKGKVLGLDLSSSMLYLAKLHFPKTMYPNLQFDQADVRDNTLGLFDVITAFSVFHFVDDPVELLCNLRSHLQKDGKLMLSIPVPSDSNSIMRIAADETLANYSLAPPWHLPCYSSKLSMRSWEGCRQKLLEAKYDIVMMRKIDTFLIFHDISECIDWFIGTASANWGVPFELSMPFFTDMMERMIELDPTLLHEDGSIILPDGNIQVIAKPLQI
jgi:trans-aconitate 2-methyltransferase